jgi:methylmalonyl-CoA mutase
MRSLATREAGSEISQALPDVIAACKVAGFDLVIVETSGIGQGDAAIVPHVDVSMYVMTPEFGALLRSWKNRHAGFRRLRGDQQIRPQRRAGCLRDVAKQYQRNREMWSKVPKRCRSMARRHRALTTTA